MATEEVKRYKLHCDKCGKALKDYRSYPNMFGNEYDQYIPETTASSIERLKQIAEANGWSILQHTCICPECCSYISDDDCLMVHYQLKLKKEK